MTIARIGSPVAMGSITTFIAGAIMLLSNVLAYIQIGTFLMVISFSSFIFSTLFHMVSIKNYHYKISIYIYIVSTPHRVHLSYLAVQNQ